MPNADISTAAYRRIGALELAAAIGLLLGLLQPLIGALAAIGLLLLLTGAVVVARASKNEVVVTMSLLMKKMRSRVAWLSPMEKTPE